MKCHRCGCPINDNAQFCSNCGTPIEQNGGNSSSSKEVILLTVVLAILIVAIIFIICKFFIFDSGKEETVKQTDIDQATTEMITQDTEVSTTTETVMTEAPETEAKLINRYEIYIQDISWEEAKRTCESMGGKLLTIESNEEFEYIQQMIAAKGYEKKILYLGGKRLPGSSEYYWLDKQGAQQGDILNSSVYWLMGEPSLGDKDLNIEEYYMNMFYSKQEGRWVFNDISNDIISLVKEYEGRVGYICEFED